MSKRRYTELGLQSDAKGTYKKMKNLINKYGIYRSYNYDKAKKSSVTLEDLRLPTQFVEKLKNEKLVMVLQFTMKLKNYRVIVR